MRSRFGLLISATCAWLDGCVDGDIVCGHSGLLALCLQAMRDAATGNTTVEPLHLSIALHAAALASSELGDFLQHEFDLVPLLHAYPHPLAPEDEWDTVRDNLSAL